MDSLAMDSESSMVVNKYIRKYVFILHGMWQVTMRISAASTGNADSMGHI